MDAVESNLELVKLSDSDKVVADPDEDVRGRAITSVAGEDLGKVDDLLIDTGAQRVRFLIAAHGGLLGIGATHSFIPVDAVTAVTDEEVRVDADRERLAAAPAYDPGLSDELGFYESIYGYYGIAPFGAPGYTTPRFPFK